MRRFSGSKIKQFFAAMGLMAFGLSAAEAEECKRVKVSIINASDQRVQIKGDKGGVIDSLPYASFVKEASLIPDSFYGQRCGLIHLIEFSKSDPRKVASSRYALVEKGQYEVHLRILNNGNIQQIGLTPEGFDLKDAIEWRGLKDFL